MAAPINPQAYSPSNTQGIYTNSLGYQLPQYPQMPTYQPSYPQMQQMLQGRFIQMIPVSSIKEVDNYPTVELTYFYCESEQVICKKDATSLKLYDLVERVQNQNDPKVEYVTKAEFDELKKLIDDLTK